MVPESFPKELWNVVWSDWHIGHEYWQYRVL